MTDPIVETAERGCSGTLRLEGKWVVFKPARVAKDRRNALSHGRAIDTSEKKSRQHWREANFTTEGREFILLGFKPAELSTSAHKARRSSTWDLEVCVT